MAEAAGKPKRRLLAAWSLAWLTAAGNLMAQSGGAPVVATPKAAAPEDLTGYWVALITEDWRYRMITPAKGDYESIPLNAAGKKVADTWDPAADEKAGNQCKAYGAVGLTRIPGRLHIAWEGESTLRIDADAGTQTRLLHFGGKLAESPEPQWQGHSVADWSLIGTPPHGGYLKVLTTNLRPGYVRKNGVPYGAGATLTEYFTRVNESEGASYLIVTSVLQDPRYLTEPFTTSTNFKKVPDASGWRPTPCVAR
jgi:hypothetical protein